MREHLFITTKYFEKCHKFQVFGVGKVSVNQFGLVDIGDRVFFLNKDDNLLIGPYEVSSDIFYNDEIIWQEKNGVDAYPYRVELRSNTIYAIDGNIFSQIVEENGIRIDSGDLGQRSVFTFLPKDLGIIEDLLIRKGKELPMPVNKREFLKNPISVKIAKERGFTESFLEFFLLKRFHKYFSNSNLLPYNQFRINLLGSKIDIIAVSENEVFVIELKKDVIKEGDIKQLEKYALWAENNRMLLGRFFKCKLDGAKIRSFIIGSDTQRNISATRDKIFIKRYYFQDKDIQLSNA